jgi:dipeptidyl-peptidase-4
MNKRVLVVVMDGVGERDEHYGNAVHLAWTPAMHWLKTHGLYTTLRKTGISIAAVSNQLFYDNIYQERYMGLPQENKQDFLNGSPVTYAKDLKGNLLYIHGTGDDNVHFSNAELLVNELIKYNKQFQYMPYPNRTHSISEGEGTFLHLSTLYTNFLKEHCPPGAR